MKMKNMIITGIALIAIVLGCGIVTAKPVERTVLGCANDDYFIYDGTQDVACPAPIHKYIANQLTPEEIEELLKQAGENQNIGGTEKIIVAKGIGYCDNEGVEYRDTIKSTTGGIEVTDWIDNEYNKGTLTIPISNDITINEYHYVDIEIV